MGTARSTRDLRQLAKHETIYLDPDYDKLREAAGLVDRRERVTRGVIAGGSTVETVGGLVAIVVAVAGFSTLPFQMAGAGVIAIGLAFLAQGSAIMTRWRDAIAQVERGRAEIRGGVTTEIFAGLGGVVLGTLALTGARPLVLLPCALLLYGAALLLGGAMQPDLVFLAPEKNPKVARVTYDAIQTSGGVMVLVGVAAAVLGILALLDVGPILVLSLVGVLVIGAALLFAGGMLTARLVRPGMFRG